MKTCKECLEIFPIDAFPKAGNKGTGRRARCRPCHDARERRLDLERATAQGRTYKPRVKFDPSSGARLCRSCETTKPLNQFAKGQRECRGCRSQRGARYRAENLEKERERHSDYHRRNRERLLPKQRELRRRYYYADIERERTNRRKYWASKTPEQRQDFYRRHREIRYQIAAIRRARILGTQAEPIRRGDIIARDNRTCYLCGQQDLKDRQIHLDHVIPLARGGTHTDDNLRVACVPCNYRKADRLLSEILYGRTGRYRPLARQKDSSA